jgi:hypothetical protein
MAIFSGKIIEAYYSNPEKTLIEIIYKEGEKAYSYYLEQNSNSQDYKDLIQEYSIEKILNSTTERLNNYRQQLKKVVSDYQKKALEKSENEVDRLREKFFDPLINFDKNNQIHQEFMFSLKLKIFDLDKIKNSKDEETKTVIRNSKTILEILNAYNKF